jgi:hypothetical protein
MKYTARLRIVSFGLLAMGLGLHTGCGTKASSGNRTSGKNAMSTVSVSCVPSDTVYILPDGISGDANATVAGDDHRQPVVCVGGQISWQIASSASKTVQNFHVFFDQSPCEGTTYPPMLYNSPIPTCKVSLKTGDVYDYKYELIIDVFDNGNVQHHYHDPHVIVAKTGSVQ